MGPFIEVALTRSESSQFQPPVRVSGRDGFLLIDFSQGGGRRRLSLFRRLQLSGDKQDAKGVFVFIRSGV